MEILYRIHGITELGLTWITRSHIHDPKTLRLSVKHCGNVLLLRDGQLEQVKRRKTPGVHHFHTVTLGKRSWIHIRHQVKVQPPLMRNDGFEDSAIKQRTVRA
jgi:hypothetical protein